MSDGNYNETDISGPCQVLYETISTEVFRKIKVSVMIMHVLFIYVSTYT